VLPSSESHARLLDRPLDLTETCDGSFVSGAELVEFLFWYKRLPNAA
jgi:hypothetical protein